MKIVSCHIENFGRLHNFDLKFDDGCMNIKGYNGWGKSTLAAFFRVMLYGFEGENKRGITDNERKRYAPWQGGVYGGSLVFEYSGGKYMATRIFGSKASDDSFELRDVNTNLVSTAFSQALGEELFGVNAESFMRTVYIGQNDLITATTGDINSKIGNIADSTSDLDCYEKAAAKLSDDLNKLSPSRATGSIYKLKSYVTSLQTKVFDGSDILEAIQKQNEIVAGKQNKYDELIADRNRLTAMNKMVSEYKDVQSLLEVYDHIIEDENGKKESAANIRSYFVKDLPKEEDISAQLSNAQNEINMEETVKRYAFSEEEQAEYDSLNALFAKAPTDMSETVELIRLWRDRESRSVEETKRQADFKVLQSELETEKAKAKKLPKMAITGMVIIVIAMLFAVTSILVLPSIKLIWIGAGISLLILLGGIVITALNIRTHNAETKHILDEKNKNLESLQNIIAEDIRYRNEMDARLSEYLAKYDIHFSASNVLEELMEIQRKYGVFNSLSEKKNSFDESKGQFEEYRALVERYLKNYGFDETGDHQAILSEMLLKLRAYNDANETYEKAVRYRRKYEEDNEVERLKSIEIPEDMLSLSEISERLQFNNDEIVKISDELKELSIQQESLLEKKEEWDENREELGVKEQELIDADRYYKNIKRAKNYLTSAKEAMTAKYMDPLLKSFGKYYGAITGMPATEYKMDANINLTVEEKGALRDVALLSSGYKDLVNFCLRLSLVDAMYKDEKPVLIFDDPFVNLDKEKTDGAMMLLKILAKDYQIFHFTCHY